jgi:hypothetical protein
MLPKVCIIFYIRAEKVLKNDKSPIYCRITVKGERAEISTKINTSLNIWNKGNVKSYIIKKKIDSFNQRLTDLVFILIKHKSPLTANNLKLFYLRDAQD